MREFAGVSAVIGWFLYLAHRALSFGFNPDDEMNLNFAIARPLRLNLESILFFWNGYIRPLGSIFYLALYQTFGYWAQPFRIAAFALIAVNLILLYRFANAILKDSSAAFLLVLAGCFHPEMWDIYASTGTIYDVLCQTFVLLAATVWVRSERTVLPIALLTVGAVESKEMGIAIPAVLLVYDVLFRPKAVRYVSIAVSGLIVVLFLAGRFLQPTEVTGNPAYTPVITLGQFLMTTRWYLDLLLFRPGLSESAAVLVLTAACTVAGLLRNRIMLFGLAFYFLTLLPMSLAPVRAGYALYVPQIGALLFMVALLQHMRNRWPAPANALSGLLAMSIIASQFSSSRRLEAAHLAPAYLPQLETLTNGVRRGYPKLPHGAQVTLVNDPFPDLYIPLFTLRAFYDDPSLQLRRIRWNPSLGPEQLLGAENALYFAGLHAWRFGALDEEGQVVDGRPREAFTMSAPLAPFNIISGVANEAGPDGSRWAFADPELVFSRPAENSQFTLDYDVPGAVLDQTGPLRLDFNVEGKAKDRVIITTPGQRRYVSDVPSGSNPLVHVKIHAENPFQGNDGAKLTFLTTRAGLQPIK